MSGKSNYLETQLLNHVLRNVSYSSPTTVYVGLFTTAPTESGGGVEVSGGSYVRQSVTFSSPSPDSCSNSTDITFPMATADWGTVEAFALFDQSSGGNMLYFANLTASREILTYDQFRFPSNQLTVSEE